MRNPKTRTRPLLAATTLGCVLIASPVVGAKGPLTRKQARVLIDKVLAGNPGRSRRAGYFVYSAAADIKQYLGTKALDPTRCYDFRVSLKVRNRRYKPLPPGASFAELGAAIKREHRENAPARQAAADRFADWLKKTSLSNKIKLGSVNGVNELAFRARFDDAVCLVMELAQRRKPNTARFDTSTTPLEQALDSWEIAEINAGRFPSSKALDQKASELRNVLGIDVE
ncbi:MAG: hypothetical protein H6707_19055 [Deltaproteobacteria bacterium]|nr:hypothetical protein [Deltaproteobacteria bacterium]